MSRGAPKSMGYRFQSVRTRDGVMLVVTPYTERGDCMAKLYAFTREETRALISCLDILPDGPRVAVYLIFGDVFACIFSYFRVPDAIRVT